MFAFSLCFVLSCACPDEWTGVVLPPLSDLSGFPDREFVRNTVRLNRQWRDDAELRQVVDWTRNWYYWQRAIDEADDVHRAWDELDDALRTEDEEFARRCLYRLRHRIGHEAYNERRMPPPFPYWAFMEIR